MASNERNHRKTEKEIQFPTKSYKIQARNHHKRKQNRREFNKYFTDTGTALASMTSVVNKGVTEYLPWYFYGA